MAKRLVMAGNGIGQERKGDLIGGSRGEWQHWALLALNKGFCFLEVLTVATVEGNIPEFPKTAHQFLLRLFPVTLMPKRRRNTRLDSNFSDSGFRKILDQFQRIVSVARVYFFSILHTIL